MIFNYLKLTVRNFLRARITTLLNLSGLAAGLAVFLVIVVFVNNELQYDRFHKEYDNIYRLVYGETTDKDCFAGTPSPLAPLLRENFPEIINFVRFDNISGVLNYQDKTFTENRIFYADESFFDIFSFDLLKGDMKNPLKSPGNMVITESAAKKYFGETDPLGKIVRYNNSREFTITAIAADPPVRSHIHFDFVVPYENFANLEHWGMWNYFTYILLDKNVDIGFLTDKFRKWGEANEFTDISDGLNFQPLGDIHFQYNRSNTEPAFNSAYINIYILAALLVLVLACINFINLSTARSSLRSLEVGVRKTFGSSRGKLVFQFLFESFLFVLIAIIIALIIAEAVLPWLGSIAERQLEIEYGSFYFLSFIFLLLLVTVFGAGAYPALLISSFQPVKILNRNDTHISGSNFRNISVVLQFVISIVLISGTIIIYNQMEFIRNRDLGFNQEYILNIKLNKQVRDKSLVLKDEMLNLSGVKNVSVNSYEPDNINWNQTVWWKGQQEGEGVNMWIAQVDRDFFRTLDIPLLEGEEILKEYKSEDERYYVINRAARDYIGWDNAAGKELDIFMDEKPGRVLAVTENYHFRSMHHIIDPYVLLINDKGKGRHISVKFQSDNLYGTIDQLNEIWKKFAGSMEMEYYFLDEKIESLYISELRMSKLFTIFSFLSLFIASLGIIGLTVFAVNRQLKEVSIRKVLGASSLSLIILFCKNFSKLVLLANIIAWPVVWYAMIGWLQTFSYRIDYSVLPMLTAGLAALVLTLLTVTILAMKAVMTNPAEILRHE